MGRVPGLGKEETGEEAFMFRTVVGILSICCFRMICWDFLSGAFLDTWKIWKEKGLFDRGLANGNRERGSQKRRVSTFQTISVPRKGALSRHLSTYSCVCGSQLTFRLSRILQQWAPCLVPMQGLHGPLYTSVG